MAILRQANLDHHTVAAGMTHDAADHVPPRRQQGNQRTSHVRSPRFSLRASSPALADA